MLRIILLSQEGHDEQSKELAKTISRELNILPVVLSQKAALMEIEAIGGRDRAGDSNILFLDAALPLTIEAISTTVNQAKEFQGHFATFSLDTGEDILSSPEVVSSTIIQALSPAQRWSFSACVVNEALLQGLGECHSVAEALLRASIKAIGEHEEIEWNLGPITAEATTKLSNFETQFSNEKYTGLLQFAVSGINIEDLFPNHQWKDFEEESAAACYHALAARFIALGAYAQAEECLQYGDRLEDSPRSLALKGLIALKQGETLAAVANMVSSLQEYEKRKAEGNGHYLTFKPRDLEIINTSLQNGLSALNKHENDAAAGYFTDAVFNFDGFYEDCGLEQPPVQ